MKRFLLVYTSRTGKTEAMAEHIAEGLRMAGHDVEITKLAELKNMADFGQYDGYVFGCPTYHKDMTQGFKSWLFQAKEAGLDGKVGGAFGSHTHSGEAPVLLHETMEHVFKMNMCDLGPLKMEESKVGTPDGLRQAQQFGRSLGERAQA